MLYGGIQNVNNCVRRIAYFGQNKQKGKLKQGTRLEKKLSHRKCVVLINVLPQTARQLYY